MGVDCFNKPEKITKKRRGGGKKCGIPGISQPSHASGDLLQGQALMKDRAMKEERWLRCGVRLASLVLPKN